MSNLMDVLYNYAQDYMLRGLLDQEPEYASASYQAGKREQEFQAKLGKEEREGLEALLDERKLMAFYEGRAMFLAGYRIAAELTR